VPLRVLVTATDPGQRFDLAEGITSHGFDVLTMATVDRAAAVIYHPHVAVIDLVVDPRAGFAAARSLRFMPAGRSSISPLAGLPIIALTADETWRGRLTSQVPAVILATDATLPGEVWDLRNRA
jgi:DNA-binding response OmpR family regulator